MDPVTAIRLVASILTFLDFAEKVVRGSYESSTKETAHIRAILEDLDEVASGLFTDFAGRSKYERALQDLALKCESLCDELRRVLEPLVISGDQSTWKCLKVMLKSMHRESEVAALEERIDEYRSQMLLRLTQMLKSGTPSQNLL